ncbi:hypothetical protein H0H92_016070 [Tricholoma furcatifolium]|nr:hypothetical protein H0H92_016070 [Tricholoma furcatifolium]
MLNNYNRHIKIGDGHHGDVYLCYKVNTKLAPEDSNRHSPVAMKSVKRDNPRAKQMRTLRQNRSLPTSEHTSVVDRLGTTEAKILKEIAIMKKCRHPHVVRLYEVIDDRSKEKIYMVMEYLAGGEVKWNDDKHQPILSYNQTRRIIRDAVLGLEYLPFAPTNLARQVHHQGIIHRDIKPANLLWTENRCQVKIADFGVSHFSYAQRLAAAGTEGENEHTEDILLDDSDLTRRAGTPSFLAPEIVYEHTNDPSPGSSSAADAPRAGISSLLHDASSQSLVKGQRPPITKAIDIWALGVTLYCLLFGKIPFSPDASGTEWSLYNSVCNLDWTAEATMCSDRVPTGGRHPKNQNTPGAMVMCLLDRLLKKDPKERITLDEVKCYKWILRDIAEPDQWLKLTMPKGKINVTEDETSDAMSTIHFQWNWNDVARRVSSLFRRSTRQPREIKIPSESEQDSARGPVKSDPHVRVRRHQSSRYPDTAYASTTHKVDKGKQRAGLHPSLCEPEPVRSKSTEPWPIARKNGASRSTSAITYTSKPRRGSGSLLSGADRKSSIISTSPAASEKPRTRFAFLKSWRPTRFSSQTTASSPTDISQRGLASSVPNPSSVTRRSEEVLRRYRTGAEDPIDRALTADRRASSWGQGDQAPEFTSLASSYDVIDSGAHAGPSRLYTDRFSPRTASRFSDSAGLSYSDEVGDGIEVQSSSTFGPPSFDDSSSSIVSADGGAVWRRGSIDAVNSQHHAHDDQIFEEDDDDDDDDDEEENAAVTFSPRKRPQPHEA